MYSSQDSLSSVKIINGDFEENNLKKQLKSRNVLKNAQSLYISNDKYKSYYD